MNRLILLVLFLFAASGKLAAQDFLTEAWWTETLKPSDLPDGIDVPGKVTGLLSFEDKGGLNYFVVSEIVHEKELKNDLYVSQWVKKGGKMEAVWDIKDFSQSLCDVHILDGSLSVLDLDGDGYMETCFLYRFSCDGMDPAQVKIMLHTRGEKLALRGKVPVDEEFGKPEYAFGDEVANYPLYFRNFMQDLWDDHIENPDVIPTTRTMIVNSEYMRVTGHYYQMASGGMSYVVQDGKGFAVDLPEEVENSIRYAQSIGLTPDGSRLYFAGLPKVGWFDPTSGAYETWVTFFEDTEAVSDAAWSPDGKRLAFITLNHSYPQSTRLFVLDIAQDFTVAKKQKFDLRVWHMAASVWVIEPPVFIGNNTIRYEKMGSDPGEDTTSESIKLD